MELRTIITHKKLKHFMKKECTLPEGMIL
ncbi:hypothetical protein D299_gp176 [Escherichia phage HX01]|nr:hypothetical protein D299_gp176 [Escherichia phage HX01]